MYNTKVNLCREKKFCVSWSGWHPRHWLRPGFYHMPYDAVHYWSLNLGPVSFHNDWVYVRTVDLADKCK